MKSSKMKKQDLEQRQGTEKENPLTPTPLPARPGRGAKRVVATRRRQARFETERARELRELSTNPEVIL